ncbi:Tigger transposable element-derived protein 1 [Anthophora retusa]
MSNRSKKAPLKRHFISLELKMQILDRLKDGEKVAYVARTLDLNEATIRTIQKSEQKIRASIAAGCSTSANMTARPRAPIIEKMEKDLVNWIDECSKKRIPLDTNVIKHKALQIYKDLKENGEFSINPDFVASKGWYDRFRKRFSLQNMKVQGKSASVDNEAARTYPKELQKIIKQRGYTTDQVFNADETGLWWRKMPKRTFISKKEKITPGFNVSKDRVTLLMCSNVSGDHMVKPMLVYRSLNPHAMKNINKNTLPVYWTANKKACVTVDSFKKWFLNCFVPSVEAYLKQKDLDFKVLLILDNAPSHPRDLNHPNVEIIFLPPNTSSLIQPLDQGVIATFKTHYIRQSLQWVLQRIDDKSIDIAEAWRLFSILDCVNIISSSIKEIKQSTLNACWKNIWPESVQSGNLIEPTENRIDAIVRVAKSLGGEGFDDMNSEDIQELLIEEDVDEADLMGMTSELDEIHSEDDSVDENSEFQNFTLESILEGINLAEQLEFHFLSTDPSGERSARFRRELHKCLTPYYEIYNDLSRKRKQTKITDFLEKAEQRNRDVEEESSEVEEILPERKRSLLIVLSSDEEEIN